ncbi:MAG: cell division protein FtsX [Geminicoccaceae bacterium]
MRSLDLPLDQTAVSRFLPWIMAGLLYLAVVALAVAAVADGALQLFDQRDKMVTVSLPTAGISEDGDRDVADVLKILNESKDVVSATVVADDELQDLIEPWLGERREGEDLPLPRLIDVALDPLGKPDLPALEGLLREVVADATIGIQEVSEGRAERQAAFFRAVGITLGALLLLCSLAIVAVITSLSLAMHDDTVTLLRYMGAQDGYLARQFERYALHSGLRGGLIGFFAAMLTVLGVLYSIQNLEMTNSIRLGLRPVDWIFLACVPVIAALLCTLMARMTALWNLGRMA